MLRFVSHSEIDFQRWDTCIENAGNGIIYSYSWYLNAACQTWDAIIEDDYQAVMPLPRRLKWGIHYIYTPFFIQQLGVFGNNTLPVSSFMEAIPKKFRLIEYNLNTANHNNLAKTGSLINWPTHHLDLGLPYSELVKRYDRTLRNNLKKANEANLVLDTNADMLRAINLFRADKGQDFQDIKNADYNRLEQIVQICLKQKKACIWGALRGNQLLSAAIFVWANNHFIFLFSGNTEEGRTLAALPFLLNKFIESKAGSAGVFDFEGSNNAGLARFYKSFGSKRVEYPRLEMSKLPPIVRYIKSLKR